MEEEGDGEGEFGRADVKGGGQMRRKSMHDV
jgi:hypothetical protein